MKLRAERETAREKTATREPNMATLRVRMRELDVACV